MAAVVQIRPTGTADEDDEWLYGGGENAENKEPEAPGTEPVPSSEPSLPKEKEEGEMSGDEQSQEKNDDDNDSDSDDDDDVQVTIGDIKAFPMNNAGPNLFKGSGSYQKQPVVAGQKIPSTTQVVKGVDVDTEGTVNGVNVFEFSLDTLRDEEKPWRKPGADITDYFNYGFNEDSWRRYCQKQNRLRADNGLQVPRQFASMGMGSHVVRPDPPPMEHTLAPPGVGHHSSTVRTLTKPNQPVAIAVLGSTAASRRPADEQMNEIQTIGTIGGGGDVKPPMGVPPPGMPPMGIPPPDYSMPPPGMPPPGMPAMPPAFAPVPPPGMPVPPPNMYNPPPVPPPFYPPHLAPPTDARGYGDRPAYSYDATPTHSSYSDSHNKNWDSRERDRDRDREYWDRERQREVKRERSPGSGYSSGEDDYRYSRSRDYGSREYESRDYYRGRDSSRGDTERSRTDRERSRSRERESSSRRHRDRDDKKSKRKIKEEPEDADYYKSSSSSSKHKKSKRSKRDKDDDSANQSEEGGGS